MKNTAQCTGRWMCTYHIGGGIVVEELALVFDGGRIAGTGENDHGIFNLNGFLVDGRILFLRKDYLTRLEGQDPKRFVLTCSGTPDSFSGVSFDFDRPWNACTFEMWHVDLSSMGSQALRYGSPLSDRIALEGQHKEEQEDNRECG